MKYQLNPLKPWWKNSWTYRKGALLLSLMQILTLVVTKNPWGITSAFVNWGAWIFESFGGSVDGWYYFDNIPAAKYFPLGFFNDPVTYRDIGIILGALISALLASQFRFKSIKSTRQVVAAAAGGLLMGYGASIASGCNIGAFYSGISVMSLSGWVFALFLFVGSIIGGKILIRYLL